MCVEEAGMGDEQEAAEEMEVEDAYWRQDSFTNSREYRSRAWGAWKRIFKRLCVIGVALSCVPRTEGEISRCVRGRCRR